MTEVWKSQGRKFCEMCKVWFGDNRASIEHHERGQKHQAAIKQKIRDLGKGNEEKARKAADLAATLAMMESGAAASMAAHNEGIVNGPALPERGLVVGPKVPVGGAGKYLDPRQMSMQGMAEEMARRKREEEEKKAELAATKKSSLWRDDDPEDQQPLPKDDVSTIMWVESEAEDGRKYYYHMFSGATSWEVPDRFFTQKEYDRRLAEIEQRAIERAKKGLPADPSQMTMMNYRGEEISTAPEIQVAKRKKAREQEEIEAELAKSRLAAAAEFDADANYGGAAAPAPRRDWGHGSANMTPMPHSSGGGGGELPPPEKKYKFTAMPEKSGPSVFATRKERRKELRGQDGVVPKEEQGIEGIPMPMAIPLPPQPPTGGGFTSSSGQYRTAPASGPPQTTAAAYGGERGGGGGYKEEKERSDGSLMPAPFPMKKEKEFKVEEEPEEEEENVTSEVLKIAATAAPFGGWTKVAKEEGISVPYVKPVTEEQLKADERAKAWRRKEEEEAGILAAAPKKVEKKIEFTEKVAPVLTKKKNAGPVEFKKKSAPKSVRRRDDEE